jgi:hypothetical protein
LGWIARRWILLPALLAGVCLCASAQPAPATNSNAQTSSAGSGVSSGASLEEYRNHLQGLDSVVAACRKQRTLAACDPAQVGADDRVTLQAADGKLVQRDIQYDWLRPLLLRAGAKDGKVRGLDLGVKVHGTQKAPVAIDQLLAEAQQRLKGDEQQAGEMAAQGLDYSAERKSLGSILARREYHGTAQVTARDRFQEWLENKIANFLEGLISIGSRAPWLGYLLEALLVGLLGTALIWALVRLERRSRVRLVPDVERAISAPSAREWQLWLKDAQAMSAQMRWREAIHFLYWASISRLESMRLWPADNARTPREYLRLLAGTDPRRANLTALTRSFERTWYGGREAHSTDFQAALEIAAALGVE